MKADITKFPPQEELFEFKSMEDLSKELAEIMKLEEGIEKLESMVKWIQIAIFCNAIAILATSITAAILWVNQ